LRESEKKNIKEIETEKERDVEGKTPSKIIVFAT
jgi:hypothetical protein